MDITELVGAVGVALDGCSAALASRIRLSDVQLTTFSATLDSTVSRGRLSLTMQIATAGPAERLLRIAKPNTATNSVSLIRDGNFLRWISADSSGAEHDVSVLNEDWHSGLHTFLAEWGGGRTIITIDGVLVAMEDAWPDVQLVSGSVFSLGSPHFTGTVYSEVELSTQP